MRAVEVGDLEKYVESRSVVKPKFTTEFLEAVVREAAEELTLRAEEAGALCTFIDTKACGTQKLGATTRGTPSARIFSKGGEGAEWKTMCNNYKELHTAVKSKKS